MAILVPSHPCRICCSHPSWNCHLPGPGATAVIPAGATGPQTLVIKCAFNDQARQWKEYKNLFDAGKKNSRFDG